MADAATTLSLMLLKESGAAADANKSLVIDGEHVATAYSSIAKQLGYEDSPRPVQPISQKLSQELLAPLTQKLIAGKVNALRTFNKGDKELVADLNRVSRMPLTPEAVVMMRQAAQSFVHFVTAGFDPMRADNYLSDGSFASTKMTRKPFLTELQAQNVVMQLFPHRILPNGDVLVRYEPNPGPVTGLSLKPYEIRMLDHEMNGVRDSAIHWIALQNVWNEKPFAADPFAAEYLTEVVSMMVTSWMLRAERVAKQRGAKSIDPAILKNVMGNTYVMVPPHDLASSFWGEEEEAHKKRALASLRTPLYKDISKQAGLPTAMPRFGSSLEKVQGHVGPDTKKVQGHVEPDTKKVQGHVEPDTKKVQGHVEPDTKKVQGHVEPDTKKVQGHVEPDKNNEQADFTLQTIMGGGVAVGDVNGDGYPDLYLTGEELGRLYLNRGKRGSARFEDVTEAMGLPTDIDDGHGTLLYDFEGDGDTDLLVLRSKHASQLFLQDGGKFRDATAELGLDTHRGAHVATVFDYDRDGDLDLYIGYYGNHEANLNPSRVRNVPALDGRNGSPNQLWRNDDGKLVEVGAEAGVADVGWTLAVGAFDYDNDGDLDLYLANDFGANAMYRNEGNGRFSDVTQATGTGDRGSGMNVDIADINGDGFWDVYVTNIDMFSKNIKVVFPRDESTINITESLTRAFQYIAGNKLYVSKGAGAYESQESLIMEPVDRGWGWDAAFYDVDGDGDDDLYVTNGWIQGSYAGNQANQLYINDGGVFFLAPNNSVEGFHGNTRSATPVDFDRDGDLDLVVNNFRQPPRLFENVSKQGNRWVQIELVGQGKNPAAIGARLEIQAGEKTILRQVSGGRGYISQADTLVTAGVADAKVISVKVLWPDGSTSSVENLATNKRHKIEQGAK